MENLGVKKEKLEDVKESKEEKVRSQKKSSANKDSGEKLESLKSPKQEIKSPKEETSKEGERKAKRKHKKMVKEAATKEKKLVEDDEAEESPAKRQKTEPVSDSGDQIMLSPPILSKWEKEDYHDDVSPRRSRKASPDSRPSKSKQDRRMLPRLLSNKFLSLLFGIAAVQYPFNKVQCVFNKENYSVFVYFRHQTEKKSI